MAAVSHLTQVVSGVERAGGNVIAYDIKNFLGKIDRSMRPEHAVQGLREGRNMGFLKVKKVLGGATRVRRTGKPF